MTYFRWPAGSFYQIIFISDSRDIEEVEETTRFSDERLWGLNVRNTYCTVRVEFAFYERNSRGYTFAKQYGCRLYKFAVDPDE